MSLPRVTGVTPAFTRNLELMSLTFNRLPWCKNFAACQPRLWVDSRALLRLPRVNFVALTHARPEIACPRIPKLKFHEA